MPLYIDRHDAPGVSPQELADAHMLDVAAQDAHGVRYHTYWFDPENGSVFCLAEGPSRDAVEAVHQDAHGLLASTVLELDPAAPAVSNILGVLLYAARLFDQAIRQCEQTLEMDPNYQFAYVMLAQVYSVAGLYKTLCSPWKRSWQPVARPGNWTFPGMRTLELEHGPRL